MQAVFKHSQRRVTYLGGEVELLVHIDRCGHLWGIYNFDVMNYGTLEGSTTPHSIPMSPPQVRVSPGL